MGRQKQLPKRKTRTRRIEGRRLDVYWHGAGCQNGNPGFRALQGRLHTLDEATGLSLLQMIRVGVAIRGAAGHGHIRFLFARVFASGGSYRTVKHLFRLLFFGDGTYYSGGVVVGYSLCSASGKPLGSGVASNKTRYRSVYDWTQMWRGWWLSKWRRHGGESTE